MAITSEQIIQVKEQLKEQVENLPEDKKEQAIAQIDSLSPQAVEALLNQSKSKTSEKDKTVFRMIVDKDIPSVIVSENKESVAVLDINPISKGHTIIIPKKPANDAKQIPVSAFTLAKKLAKRIIGKLEAKSTEMQTETKFGETIINLIPCYTSPLSVNSARSKSSIEELEKIASLIRDKPKSKIQKIKIVTKKSSENHSLQLKRRIP